MGKTDRHIQNSKDFVEKINKLELQPGEVLISYDVSALFTSIPVDVAVQVIEDKLKSDVTLSERTTLSSSQVADLLRFCLNQTYFQFQGKFYKQTHGCAMGSPVSPTVANIYMEYF